jgi:hypothetical protein
MTKRMLLAVMAGLWLSAAPVLAHHTFSADFDSNKPVTLNGTITKIQWTNPHVYTFMNVKDNQGKMKNWKVEMGSPADLGKEGWTRNSLKVGNMVTVKGWQGITQNNLANADSVTLSTGKTLSAASSYHESTTAGTSGTKTPATTDKY